MARQDLMTRQYFKSLDSAKRAAKRHGASAIFREIIDREDRWTIFAPKTTMPVVSLAKATADAPC